MEAKHLEAVYRTMLRIRRFDEGVMNLFKEGLVKGTAHSYVGQEAVAAGACAALTKADFVVSHHRGHGHCIAKGASLDRMMAELMGRVTGYCKGLGGSMHIADLEHNILGANGIVGAGIGIGTGAALTNKLRGNDAVGVVFFGDGAANEGIFHEGLNLGSLWKLPVVYLCENNQYGLSTSMKDSTAVDRISKRAGAYSMPGVTVDGNDVLAVHAAVQEAVARARKGDGPTLIEALTYRWGDHSMRANLPRYRTEAEEVEWHKLDAVARFEQKLETTYGFKRAALDAIGAEVEAELGVAKAFAIGSPEPTLDDLEGAVYAPHYRPQEPRLAAPRELSFTEAIKEALAQEMERDPRVFVLGEDVGKIGGIFAATRGLIEKFGPERVRDTPISEAAIAACAVGAAITGMRPVAEVQIFDFITHMMDMIVNQAAKFRFMLGGKPTVPLVIRGPQGGGIRLAAQHSQSLEAWFTHVPGLVVLGPSSAYEAKGLLISAIREDNPVIFLEHKMLYVGKKAPVPEEAYAIPIGKAVIKRHGSDVTLVATMAMVESALQAATRLEADGIDVEVIDPRTLRPLDEDTIIQSVKKTSRLVIAHEGWKRSGFGAEVAAMVAEKAIDWLDAPIVRVGARESPMPYNDKLERLVIPQAEDIVDAIKAVVLRDRVGAKA
ncbi:MAG TPA: dehydrogenase E1 component subunit alpha/beta [Usitatibacteraceae bacterium]|nr:dehydrogenase E1 component subunit alpha/beta [Usitatibacteraceae bacterium]